jgi:hypothetical protein
MFLIKLIISNISQLDELDQTNEPDKRARQTKFGILQQ